LLRLNYFKSVSCCWRQLFWHQALLLPAAVLLSWHRATRLAGWEVNDIPGLEWFPFNKQQVAGTAFCIVNGLRHSFPAGLILAAMPLSCDAAFFCSSTAAVASIVRCHAFNFFLLLSDSLSLPSPPCQPDTIYCLKGALITLS
jgi:hypothetical protein